MSDGVPPLKPLPVDEWSDETREVLLGHLRRPELYLSGRPDAPPMPGVMGLFANHHQISDAFLRFTEELASPQAALRAVDRELVILRVSWRLPNAYEWGHHARAGTHAGLTRDHIYAIPEGPSAAAWSPEQRALLTVADDIIDHGRVTRTGWELAQVHFDQRQLLELYFLVGGYIALAAVLNSARLEPDPPTEPIDAPAIGD
jgi:4-carboxymuconolactone decarboxylase